MVLQVLLHMYTVDGLASLTYTTSRNFTIASACLDLDLETGKNDRKTKFLYKSCAKMQILQSDWMNFVNKCDV